MAANVLAYADDIVFFITSLDDIVLLAPSWRSIRDLLHLLSKLNTNVDMTCSTKKTACMVFQPKQHSKLWLSLPPLRLGSECLQYVSSFKYLGHAITTTLTDDIDIQLSLIHI